MPVDRWSIARHTVQLAIIVLLLAPLWSRSVFEGTLASAALFGLRLSDPLATLQVLLLTGTAALPLLAGAALVAALYALLGGRVFCGWVCPLHLLTELAELAPTSRRLPRWPLHGKYLALLLTALLTVAFGAPAFETVSPIGIAVRSLTFGVGSGLLVLALLLAAETTVARRLWCRSLCPLGGLHAFLGRFGLVRVGYAATRCVHCGRCREVCCVPEVLSPALDQGVPRVASGECSRCGACVGNCPTRALTFHCGPKSNQNSGGIR